MLRGLPPQVVKRNTVHLRRQSLVPLRGPSSGMWASAAIPTSAAGDHGLGLRFYDVPVRATSRRTRQNVPGFGGTQRNKSSKLFLERINVVRLHRPRDMSFRHATVAQTSRYGASVVRDGAHSRRDCQATRGPGNPREGGTGRCRALRPTPACCSPFYRGMVLTRAFDLKAVSRGIAGGKGLPTR